MMPIWCVRCTCLMLPVTPQQGIETSLYVNVVGQWTSIQFTIMTQTHCACFEDGRIQCLLDAVHTGAFLHYMLAPTINAMHHLAQNT